MSSPKQKTLRVSPGLKAFLARVHARIEANDYEHELDAFQSQTTFGGPSDARMGRFEFTHFAEHGRCRFILSAQQIHDVGRGAVGRIDVERDALVPQEAPDDIPVEAPSVAAGTASTDEVPVADEEEFDLASVIMAKLAGEPAPRRQEDPRANKFVELLVKGGAIELCEGAHPAQLVAGVKEVLQLDEKPKHKAKALSEWLFDQEGIVEEVYIDDRKLAKLIWSW